jgi:hypothetical protein
LSDVQSSFSFLTNLGYCPVRLPNSMIKPLQLYETEDFELNLLGEISDLFISSEKVALPPIEVNSPTANISGQRSRDLNMGLGLSILSGIISAFVGAAASLDSVYQKAASVSFQYEDVLLDTVNIINLDKFLNCAKIDENSSKHIIKLLNSGRVYVISATVKSQKLTVLPKTADGADLKVDLNQVQNVVGSKVKVSRGKFSSEALTFEGDLPLIFGFKTLKLLFHKGQYEGFESEGEVCCDDIDLGDFDSSELF